MHTKDTVIEAIAQDKSLEAAWSELELSRENPDVKEGWMAWEWCLRQLRAKMPDSPSEHALALRSVYMQKARRLGTYSAIAECLNGETPTLIF